MKMSSLLTDYDATTSQALLEIYAEQKVYNPARMEEIARELCNRMENTERKATVVSLNINRSDITPEKRSIKEYLFVVEKGGM
jgi:hypothetical protein